MCACVCVCVCVCVRACGAVIRVACAWCVYNAKGTLKRRLASFASLFWFPLARVLVDHSSAGPCAPRRPEDSRRATRFVLPSSPTSPPWIFLRGVGEDRQSFLSLAFTNCARQTPGVGHSAVLPKFPAYDSGTYDCATVRFKILLFRILLFFLRHVPGGVRGDRMWWLLKDLGCLTRVILLGSYERERKKEADGEGRLVGFEGVARNGDETTGGQQRQFCRPLYEAAQQRLHIGGRHAD